MRGGYAIAFVLLLGIVLLGYLTRYDYTWTNNGGVLVTDRWLGTVKGCDLQKCIRLYPPNPNSAGGNSTGN